MWFACMAGRSMRGVLGIASALSQSQPIAAHPEARTPPQLH